MTPSLNDGFTNSSTGAFLSDGGARTDASSRAGKTGFESVDVHEVLDAVTRENPELRKQLAVVSSRVDALEVDEPCRVGYIINKIIYIINLEQQYPVF